MIKIIKKTPGVPVPVAAPVVAPVAPTVPVASGGGIRITPKPKAPPKPAPKEYPPETDEQRLARWKAMPGPNEKVKQCTHCEQWYIRPCTAPQAANCANYRHLKAKTAA